MINILIVDDDANKTGKIKRVINEFSEIDDKHIHTEPDLIGARRSLLDNQFDLMVLDLYLPDRFGDDAIKNGGLDLIYEISAQQKLKKPFHIIGLTAYGDLLEKYSEKFHEHLWLLIIYEQDNVEWEKQLSRKIRYLIDSKKSLETNKIEYDYDLCIITALPVTEMQSILDLDAGWQKLVYPDDPTIYYQGVFKNNETRLRTVAASTPQMGMVASSVLSTKMIIRFRPVFIAITGIAAGIEGKGNYGDILISDQTWDYGNGKINTEENGKPIFLPDPQNIHLDSSLKEKFFEAQRERKYVNEIRDKWLGNKPNTPLETFIGPFASGSFVVNHESVFELIEGQSRKIIGIDMETYGVFFAAANCGEPRPVPISVKSISDFGVRKTDDYHNYAAYTSAQYLYRFALDELKK